MKLLPISLFTSMLVIVLASALHAQDTFIVMSAKGKVEYKEGKKQTSWKAVKVGQELTTAATLKTSYASYVKLMMNNSRLVGIDENTTKALSAFGSSKKGKTKSSTSTILAYAAKQMKQNKEKETHTEFGAVRGSRDVFNAAFPKYAIMTTTPVFRIVDEEVLKPYEVVVLDKDLHTVAKQIVDTSVFMYDMQLPKIQEGETYYWQATRLDDGVTSDIQRFTVLPADPVENIRMELRNMREELDAMGADDVMLHLIRGVYFEQKQLYYDAYTEYRATVQLAPDVEEYRDMLRTLLLKLSLYNEQDMLME